MMQSPTRPRTSHGRGRYGNSKLSARDYSNKVTDVLGFVGQPDVRGHSQNIQRNHVDDINAIRNISFGPTKKRKRSKRKLETGLEPLEVAKNRQHDSESMQYSSARIHKKGSPARSYFVESFESPASREPTVHSMEDRRQVKKSSVGWKTGKEQRKKPPVPAFGDAANQTIDIHDRDEETDWNETSSNSRGNLKLGKKKKADKMNQNALIKENRDDSPNTQHAKTTISSFFLKVRSVERQTKNYIRGRQSTCSVEHGTDEADIIYSTKKSSFSRPPLKSAKCSSRHILSTSPSSPSSTHQADTDDGKQDRNISLTSSEQATSISEDNTAISTTSSTMKSIGTNKQDSSEACSTPSTSEVAKSIILDVDDISSARKTPLSGQKEADTVSAIEKEVVSYAGMKRSAEDNVCSASSHLAKKPRRLDEQQKSPIRRLLDGTVGTVQSVLSNVASGLKFSRQKDSVFSSRKRGTGRSKGKRIEPGVSLSRLKTELDEESFTFLSKVNPDRNQSRTMGLREDGRESSVKSAARNSREKHAKTASYTAERRSSRRNARSAGQAIEILSDSDGDVDSSYDRDADSLSLNVVRIAIGKRIFSEDCKLKLVLNGNASKLVLLFRKRPLVPPSNTCHVLDLNQLEEVKYFSISKMAPEERTSCDIQHSILAMKIGKNAENGLQNYNNAYQPEGDSMDKRYLVVEFGSDDEFLALISMMEQLPVPRAFLSNAQLSVNDVGKYCGSLSPARRRRMRSNDTEERPEFLRGRADDDVILVYPFAGALKEIEAAAMGLKEAGEGRLTASDMSEVQVAGDPCSDEEVDKSDIRRHYVTVHVQDYLRLNQGEFLNDSLIDFWMQWISRHDRSQIHIFTSHFYSTLVETGVSSVSSWTKNRGINIFEKKLIFVPVNKSLHWSLCVLVNPGAIESHSECDEIGYEGCEDKPVPCMLFFDSLNMHEKHKVAENLRKWLNTEWSRLKNSQTKPFNRNTMKVESPKVPTQDNFFDCGVFVCMYAYAMYQLRHKTFSYRETNHHKAKQSAAYKDLITESPLFRFSADDIHRMRDEMKVLIERLTKTYRKWRLEEEAKRKAKKRKAATQSEPNGSQEELREKEAEQQSLATQPEHSQESSDVVEVLSPPLTVRFESSSPSLHAPASTQMTELLSQESQCSISEQSEKNDSIISTSAKDEKPDPLDTAEQTKVTSSAVSAKRPHVESMYRATSGGGFGSDSGQDKTEGKSTGRRLLHAEI